MKPVKISFEEAQGLLNLLRNVQMNLGAAVDAVGENARAELYLCSMEFAGELHQTINQLEGSIFESQMPEPPDPNLN